MLRRVWHLVLLSALALLAESRPGLAGAEAKRILMLGDSLTAGLGLPLDATLPVQLEAALRARGRAVHVINAGVSGDTTAGGRARLAWSLEDDPDIVIIALGGNDGLRAIPPAETRRNLEAILATLQERGVTTVLAGMLAPRNLGTDYEREFDAIFPELAAAHNVVLYPFLLDGVAFVPELNQADGFHPNRQGMAVIAERLTPVLLPLLEAENAAAAGG